MQSGKLGYLESLRKAVVLIRELEVTSLDDLEQAAREGRVRGLKGFGEKTELLILEGIPKVRARQGARRPLWETRPLAEQLLERVRAAPGVLRAEIAGSVRRYAETNGDIDIVAAGGPPEPVMEAFANAPGVSEILARASLLRRSSRPRSTTSRAAGSTT